MTSGAPRALIFSVDGVLADAPHENCWRLALEELCARPDWREAVSSSHWEPESFTHEAFISACGGKACRRQGQNLLDHFNIADPDGSRLAQLVAEKQRAFLESIEQGDFGAHDDAIDLARRAREAGWQVAVASGSRSEPKMLEALDIMNLFDASFCAWDAAGKPAPDLYEQTAAELGLKPRDCCVVESTGDGLRAARAAGFMCLAVARYEDMGDLWAAGAHLVADRLSDVTIEELDLHIKEVKR